MRDRASHCSSPCPLLLGQRKEDIQQVPWVPWGEGWLRRMGRGERDTHWIYALPPTPQFEVD